MKARRSNNILSRKLLFAFLGALVTIVMAVTLIGAVLMMFLHEDYLIQALYLSQLIILILIIIAFYFIMNRMVVRRIQLLNNAMQEVARGDYETTLPVTEHDELSTLTTNFNQMTAELNANAFLAKEFTRYVSHEFKTPLSVIRSHAEAAQDAQTQEELKDYMAVVIAETDRLAGISKNIMDLCRLDSTTIIMKEDVFSPAAQIRSILLSTQFVWNVKNITMDLELEEFEVQSNEALLFRVWENVIGNAIKFTENNGHIAIQLAKVSNKLAFSITDDGIGMTEEDQQKVFDPFFMADPSHHKEGSGLGLSLTKKIIDKLEGSIQLTSQYGKGSTFVIDLPL